MALAHNSEVVNQILDQALKSDVVPRPSIHHPFVLDVLISVGLLLAAGGFTLCMLQLYVDHAAQQCLIKRDYKSTIALLNDPPFPVSITSSFGYNPKEILNEALYKDAMIKIEVQGNAPEAVKELQRISPDSNFFYNAQRTIDEYTTPSGLILEGGTSVVAAPVPMSSSEKLDYLLQAAEDRALK